MWSLKLQTEISTSTAEAKYSSLATGTRALISLHYIFKEITTTFDIQNDCVSHISQLLMLPFEMPITLGRHLVFLETFHGGMFKIIELSRSVKT